MKNSSFINHLIFLYLCLLILIWNYFNLLASNSLKQHKFFIIKMRFSPSRWHFQLCKQKPQFLKFIASVPYVMYVVSNFYRKIAIWKFRKWYFIGTEWLYYHFEISLTYPWIYLIHQRPFVDYLSIFGWQTLT